MPYAIYTSAAFTNGSGLAVAAGAEVEVREELTGNLATIYEDRDGSEQLTNPFNADSSGRFQFFAEGVEAGYRVKVTKGDQEFTLRYQPVGLAQYSDFTLSFPIGSNRVVGQTASTPNSPANVGSMGIGIDDGGGSASGVFVYNTHDGTYSSQDIRFLTAQGGISATTERARIDSTGLAVTGALTTTGNVGIGGASFGSGAVVMFIAKATTAPTTNPSGGGVLYVENGSLKYRGSSGTVTTIANA
jgi:hypothetical protein